MPGVPSGRGCDACRRHKKKCDQGKPSCSRCSRLKIDCKGAGQQRFAFQAPILFYTDPRKKSKVIRLINQASQPKPCLSSETSRTASGLVALLHDQDLRFDITVFGFFWSMIPQRLGVSEALDAAVDALVLAVPNLYDAQGSASSQSIVAFGKAMSSVRNAMGDDDQARTSNLVCAVFILLIIHNMIDSQDSQTVHIDALAHLLPRLMEASHNTRDDFDLEMIAYVNSCMTYAAMFMPQISVQPGVETLLQYHRPVRPFRSDDGRSLYCLSREYLTRLPSFCHCPQTYVADIWMAYQQVSKELPIVERRMSDVLGGCSDLATDVCNNVQKAHAQWQVAYSVLLTVALFLNTTLQILDSPLEDSAALENEGFAIIDAIFDLARSMMHLRPLFSTGILNPLFLAWATNPDANRLTEVERMLNIYLDDKRMDPRPEQLWSGAIWFAEHFRRLRSKMSVHKADVAEVDLDRRQSRQVAEEPMPEVGNCVIL